MNEAVRVEEISRPKSLTVLSFCCLCCCRTCGFFLQDEKTDDSKAESRHIRGGWPFF